VLGLRPALEGAPLAGAEHRAELGRPGGDPELVAEGAADIVEGVHRAATGPGVADHDGGIGAGGEGASDRVQRIPEVRAPGALGGRARGVEAAARADLAVVEPLVTQPQKVQPQPLVLGVVVGPGVRRRGQDAPRSAVGDDLVELARIELVDIGRTAGAAEVGEAGVEDLDALREVARGRAARDVLRDPRGVGIGGARADLVEDRGQARGEDVGDLGIVLAVVLDLGREHLELAAHVRRDPRGEAAIARVGIEALRLA